MSGLFSLLGIARDGLEAHGAALLVTGQNVTQANVAGYVRKTAVFETRPGTTGGVHVAGVARHFDRFTFGRLLGESGQKSEAFARSSALDAVEGVLAPETGSIAERLAAFEASMRALGADASNPSLRSVALSDAAALATSVSTTAAGLARASDDTFTKAVGVAQDLEGRLATIATLNRRIAEATGAGTTRPTCATNGIGRCARSRRPSVERPWRTPAVRSPSSREAWPSSKGTLRWDSRSLRIRRER